MNSGNSNKVSVKYLKTYKFTIPFILLLIITLSAFNCPSGVEKQSPAENWELVFEDDCTNNWKENWFLDGEKASVTNSYSGMHYSAGAVNGDDAHHAVLWTKQSFKGDVKITYDFTRTDQETRNVCILYIQATGTGNEPYFTDISKWNHLRKVPAMSTYFNNMNALHISYAAFTNKGEKYDYVRARRYPTSENVSFNDTKIPPSYDNVGFFETGKTYHITVIKTGSQLSFLVQGENGSRQFTWDTSDFRPITEGRIGLRHMYTRSAIYKNFRVYTKKPLNK